MNDKYTGKTVKFTLDPKDPPKLSQATQARLAAMTDQDIDFSDIPPSPKEVAWLKPGAITEGMGKCGHLDSDTEKATRRFLTLIASHYHLAGAIVYGSRAHGTHRLDSDADVAIILKGEHQRTLTTMLAMADVAYDVLLETGINISPLPVWLDQWEYPESHTNPTLLHNIAREGVRL